MGKSRSYQLVDAARVVDALSKSTIVERPKSEAVARELAAVLRHDPDEVEEVWSKIVAHHGPEPTAAQTRDVVRKHQAKANAAAEPVKVACPVCGSGVRPNGLFGGRLQKLLDSATEEQWKALDDKRRKAAAVGRPTIYPTL